MTTNVTPPALTNGHQGLSGCIERDPIPVSRPSQQNDDAVSVTIRRGGAEIEFRAAGLREASTRLGALWPQMFAGPQREVAAMEAMAVAIEDGLRERRHA